MKVTAVIPARMGSSRFPGKPLANIVDLPMVEHVRRRAELCDAIDEVIVATCDQEIIDAVASSGGQAVMTKDTHERCTDRVEEAVAHHETDIVMVLQGDEPLIDPKVMALLLEPLKKDESILCTNLISIIDKSEDVQDCDIVKAVLNQAGNIMAFSRSPIPYERVSGHATFYRQTGMSAFRKDFLHQFSALEPTPLEITESVDFMRIVEHGFPIKAVIYDQETIGVDRPEDVALVEDVLQEDEAQKAIYQKMLAL